MRKFKNEFALLLVSVAALGLQLTAAIDYGEILYNTGRKNILTESKSFLKKNTPMHKALFTQRGYIQFLRWELPVPEIEEFTFCLWVKSTNLTYSHSIFSYSKNEEKRLVRSWISPFGRSIHLEIGEIEILSHPTNIEEHRWYHICQTWDNEIGHYGLWIDGLKLAEGFATQLIGHVIPSNGDIVVGQEYTDFDKGFEEGIEGAVLGFNLILSSAFDKIPGNIPRLTNADHGTRQSFIPYYHNPSTINEKPQSLPPLAFGGLNQGIKISPSFDYGVGQTVSRIQPRKNRGNIPRGISSPRVKILNDEREGLFDSTLKEYLGPDDIFTRNMRGVQISHRNKRASPLNPTINKKTLEKRIGNQNVPLGLQLIELSYNHCEVGRGSPFIGGSRMLISWTRTPVKVFGGAIIKDAKNTCGDF